MKYPIKTDITRNLETCSISVSRLLKKKNKSEKRQLIHNSVFVGYTFFNNRSSKYSVDFKCCSVYVPSYINDWVLVPCCEMELVLSHKLLMFLCK